MNTEMKKYIKPCTKWAELESGAIMLAQSTPVEDGPNMFEEGTDEAALGREISSKSLWDSEW